MWLCLWCWVTDPAKGLAFYYLPLVAIWCFAIFSVVYSCYAVRRRIRVVLREIISRHR